MEGVAAHAHYKVQYPSLSLSRLTSSCSSSNSSSLATVSTLSSFPSPLKRSIRSSSTALPVLIALFARRALLSFYNLALGRACLLSSSRNGPVRFAQYAQFASIASLDRRLALDFARHLFLFFLFILKNRGRRACVACLLL